MAVTIKTLLPTPNQSLLPQSTVGPAAQCANAGGNHTNLFTKIVIANYLHITKSPRHRQEFALLLVGNIMHGLVHY